MKFESRPSSLLSIAIALGALSSPATSQAFCPPGGGNALEFDGVDDHVSCGDVLPTSNQPHTLEAWVRIAPDAPLNALYLHVAGQMGLRCCSSGFSFRYTNGTIRYLVDPAACGSACAFIEDPLTELGAWHHYAGTWDGASASMYRDGVLVNTVPCTAGFGAWGLFTIGALSTSGCGGPPWINFFPGAVDEVRLWDHARSQAEIAADMDQLLCGSEPGLIGYWPMEEGFGATTADSSPGGNDGAISGAQWIQYGTPCFATYCFGDAACPCGNTDPTAGCATSTGAGALLQAGGTPSVASDDLVLTASGVPPNQNGILFMGGGQMCGAPFGAGLLCVSPGPASFCRFPVQSSGASGVMTEGPGIVAFSLTLQPVCHIVAGDTWNFQGWFRDPQGPCSETFNLSNAVAVTFAP